MIAPSFSTKDPFEDVVEEVLRKSEAVLSEFQEELLSYSSDKKL